MANTGRSSRDLSIKMIFVISFTVMMLATVAVIGFITFRNWIASGNESATRMSDDLNAATFAQIDTFLQVPLHISEANHIMLENGVVNLLDKVERERFFAGVMTGHDSGPLYSVAYGTEDGAYYGARRNERNEIEIMINNASTGGSTWYYATTADLTAGELVLQTAKFDPRTRDWYMAAKAAPGTVFSPIYKHFVLDDLTVSAAIAVIDDSGRMQGVLGAHIVLSRIDSYLTSLVDSTGGIAVIAERATGHLIANSLGQPNFAVPASGALERLDVRQIGNQAIADAFDLHVAENGDGRFRLPYQNDTLHVKATDYRQAGLDWVIVTAVPGSLFTAGIMNSLRLSVVLAVFASLLALYIYNRLTGVYLRPIDDLIATSNRFSQGDLAERAIVHRQDEIGEIATSFNQMAGTMHSLVDDLEAKVRDRTAQLEDSKDNLQLLLDSTAEGVYGTDTEGRCTFCNQGAARMLGYDSPDQLVGKNMHSLMHHSHADGSPIAVEDCRILRALASGQGTHADDEVFWRRDGSSIEVEYRSHPQYRDGVVIGAVISFMDNAERRRAQEHINYLTYHDSLTGLFNRPYFEEALVRLDTRRNLPISIVFGDVNGLKLTNDVMGHAAGDLLLKRAAAALRQICRDNDVVARVGGDEFAIILPRTSAAAAGKVVARIKRELAATQAPLINTSISMGVDTKSLPDEEIERTMASAESAMYREKTVNRKATGTEMIKTIMDALHAKSPRDAAHSQSVSLMCERIGRQLQLQEVDVRRLREAGYLHDIGKAVLDADLVNKRSPLTREETLKLEQHPMVGYRILNLFDETADLAEIALCHRENWDGSGYPTGLRGEEIPLLARIVRVADQFDALTTEFAGPPIGASEALTQIKGQAGRSFDPLVVKALAELVED